MTDEGKRWLVVGITMNKEAAPVLRDFIKQEMNTHYTNLDAYCSGLTPGCTLKTLTRHQVTADRTLKRLNFRILTTIFICMENPLVGTITALMIQSSLPSFICQIISRSFRPSMSHWT